MTQTTPVATAGSGAHTPSLLTAEDVAALLRVPKSWVYAETRAGRIPHVVLGPRYRRYETTRHRGVVVRSSARSDALSPLCAEC